MKSINKEGLLNKLENKVESQLKEIIEVYQNQDEAILIRQSTTGGWSIAQCFQHLNTYGYFYLPQIKKGMDKQITDISTTTFKSSRLGNYFTNLMEPGTSMKKMKAFRNHIPDKDLDAHAVVAEFIQQQETLLAYLKIAITKNLETIKIPVSISKFIKLRLGDVLQFIVAHNARHLQQAQRNL